MSLVSIIIRTKDEEDWIGMCLKAIQDQEIKHKVEIVIVDNISTDKTVAKARQIVPDLKLVELVDYRPGLALNKGIAAASGDIIVCLSAHCIPANSSWLRVLCDELSGVNVAGVYGRQIPLASTPQQDIRDLWIVFGLDKRIQTNDPFFHNANSAFFKSAWADNPFNEEVYNLEDRVWGQVQVNHNKHIVYCPDAVVYHHHGIHQKGNKARCDGVIKIMRELHSTIPQYNSFFDPFRHQSSLLVVPVSIRYGSNDRYNFVQSIQKLKNEQDLFDVLVLPDSPDVQEMAEKNGFLAPLIREHPNSKSVPPLIDDLQHLMRKLDSANIYYDYVALAEMIYPNRRNLFFSEMLKTLRQTGADSILAAWVEKRPVLIEREPGYTERFDDFRHSLNTRRPVYIGVPGLGVITKPDLIRKKQLFSETSAIFPITDWKEIVEIRGRE